MDGKVTNRCKAITKKNERCKRIALRGYYCWMHTLIYNKVDRAIAIIALAITICLPIYLFVIGPSLKSQEKLLINDEEIRLNILSQNLKHYPGRVFILLALFKENSSSEKEEYIFDYGRSTSPSSSRVLIYIDTENNLVFELIDAQGKKHFVTVNHKGQGFEFNKKYLWYFEYGNHTFESYMRVFANGKLIGEKTINYDIDIGTLKEKNESSIGASLFGYYPSHFDCWTYMITKTLMNAEEERGVLNIFYDKQFKSLFGGDVPKWAKFDGSFYYFNAIGASKLITKKTKEY